MKESEKERDTLKSRSKIRVGDFHLEIQENLQQITGAELQQALEALPDWRREAALKFKHEAGQRACAFSYLLLCQLLKEVYGITEQPHFLWGEHGKPTLLEHPEIHFNLSHCREALAVAVGPAPVGVDVECTGRCREGLLRYACSEEEVLRIQTATNPDREFTRLWTQKEAVAKLQGTGITDGFKEILLQDVHLETFENSTFITSIAY